jgi:multiple sugar transport system permease protein/putative aldouronate transport system permease protein
MRQSKTNIKTQAGFFQRRWLYRDLYLLILIPVIYVLIFNYGPMYGVLMAFKRFAPRLGVWKSPWVGFYNFERLFKSPIFFIILRNTLVLSFYNLIASFPFAIILAICINHCIFVKFKKVVQSLTFCPHFLSAVLMVGLIIQVLSTRTGTVNIFLSSVGLPEINFLGSAILFPHVYVWSHIWQNTGYGAIIYISSLAAVDPTYHEAAIIDGANLWQRVWHIDLPTIKPIIIIMLILSMGRILGGNLEVIYLMQNSLNIDTSEIINTYVYKVGIVSNQPDYSFGTAIGLFQNVVGLILTLTVNRLANKISGEGMF